MNTVSLDFQEALKILKTYPESTVVHKAEQDAIFTHWLQNMDSVPIFMKGTTANDLKKYLLSKLDMKQTVDTTEIVINFDSVPFPPSGGNKFTFIDLFAGIGGFRIALQNVGGKCLFSSDWDKGAKLTYFNNHAEVPFGDIRLFTSSDISDKEIDALIPDHDILTAGFPCQPFSRAGVSARISLGRSHGFSDTSQGNLFFDIARIVKVKRPKVLFLENVKNLKAHDGGKTFEVIKRTIKEELGYTFDFKIIDARTTVPQKRQRCYMVCFRDKPEDFEFEYPEFNGEPIPLKSILEENVSETYTISDKLWTGHKNRSKRNIARGTGFTASEADLDKPANTLVARYGKDGKECLIPQKNKNPRKLTPRECARIMGYPDKFIYANSNTASYKQFGNSLVVPVVEKIATEIITQLDEINQEKGENICLPLTLKAIGAARI
jgi:DNA (cytosine-5)-methyltransferase 1